MRIGLRTHVLYSHLTMSNRDQLNGQKAIEF